MTDAFQHPDGHHYRFLGFGPCAAKASPRPLRKENDGQMIHTEPVAFAKHSAVFERVGPPKFPWKAPSGFAWRIGPDGSVFGWYMGEAVERIPPEDFAGLSERLAKQAELNKEQA